MRAQVYIGMGSQLAREHNIRHGLARVQTCYSGVEYSPVYQSRPIGIDGDDFFNLVARFETAQSVAEVAAQLHDIELEFGTKQAGTDRLLDIDLLLYGDLISPQYQLPRADIIKYAFVLKPLADLAPALVHPVKGQTIGQLWANFGADQQQIKQIDQAFIV